MKIEKDKIMIRDFAASDLPLLLKWLTDERVLRYYEGRDMHFTMESLAAHFLEEISDGFRMIISYADTPIGYGQACRLHGEMFAEYDYPDQGKNVFAMDQFIGEPEYWSKGIGTAYLQMLADYLKEQKAADVLLLDPHQNNPRAVRAYEKAGFQILRSLPEHELFEGKKEDCWLMERNLTEEKNDMARRGDWKSKPMPAQHETFLLERTFCAGEMASLRRGHIPQDMEDKWFWYMENSTLFAHRSWTGYCIYRIDFPEDGPLRVTVNRDPEQYACTSIEEDKVSLNKLLDWWTKTPYDTYGEWLSETAEALKKKGDA